MRAHPLVVGAGDTIARNQTIEGHKRRNPAEPGLEFRISASRAVIDAARESAFRGVAAASDAASPRRERFGGEHNHIVPPEVQAPMHST